MKKGLILTLTLKSGNYGGILQAFALQRIVRLNGGPVLYVDYPQKIRRPFRVCMGKMKRATFKLLFKRQYGTDVNTELHRLSVLNTQRFIIDNIRTVDLFSGRRRPKDDMLRNFKFYVVGSDQVWRNAYADVADNMFQFVAYNDVTRFSYAASFGRDDLDEYGPALIRETAKLAQKFDAISVREDSGVGLVQKYWGREAIQHVDPTLLLDKQDYVKLVDEDSSNIHSSKGSLFVYVLDKNTFKSNVTARVESSLKLKAFDIMPPKPQSIKELKLSPATYQLPPITQWIKSFIDAKYVVTDSFHGCVFSIIFNKPFIAIGNENRGLTRFTSLLKLFGLESRLVLKEDDATDDLIKQEIDWRKVNTIIKREQKRSFDYLKKHLGSENGQKPKLSKKSTRS